MSKCQVIGFARTQFKGRESDQQYSGYNIWVAFPANGVTGCRSDRLFLLDGKSTYIPQVDDMISISYNKYGKVENIEVV